MILFTQGYKWVPTRVEVDIVYEKGHSCLPRAVHLKIKGSYWPNDQGTNVNHIEMVSGNVVYKNQLLISYVHYTTHRTILKTKQWWSRDLHVLEPDSNPLTETPEFESGVLKLAGTIQHTWMGYQ